MPSRLQASCRRTAGFTLLEVTVAIGVFGLLVAGAFGLAVGSIELTREVSGFESRELARMRFLQLCRATLRELPGTARFLLLGVSAPKGGGDTQVLCLAGHPRAFPVGTAGSLAQGGAGILAELTLLSSRPDGAGGQMIQLHHLAGEEAMRFEEKPALEGLMAEPLTLLRGIKLLQWRFYDAKREEWVEEWEEEGLRPRFVELMLQLHGDLRPSRSVFWVPEAHVPADFQPPPSAPPTDNPTPPPAGGENVPPPGQPDGGSLPAPQIQLQGGPGPS